MLVKYCKYLYIFLFICVFASCDEIIGLGTKVNTENPVISVPKGSKDLSAPGSFLSGSENIVYFEASVPLQGFKINSLYLSIQYFNKDGEEKKETIAGFFDFNKKKWAINIDTIALNMEDGKITVWATAIDSSGRQTTTTDIIYYVKNLPPQIQLTIPAVKPEDFDNPNLNEMLEHDPLYIGMDLMGIASDNLGLAKGFPKIMIWPSDAYLNTNDEPIDNRYNGWHDLVVPKKEEGLKMTKFSWPMYELVQDEAVSGEYRLPALEEGEEPVYLKPGEYSFKIWVRDMHGKDNFYPYSPNKNIKIKYTAAEIPIISVTNIPSFYNGTEDFIVKFNITSSSNLSLIDAVIRDKDDGTHSWSAAYTDSSYFKLINKNANTFSYEFRLPAKEAAKDFNAAKNGNLFIFLHAEDSNQRSSPLHFRNFIYDSESAKVTFNSPVNISAAKYKGKLGSGIYEIFYPSAAQGPKWVTGETQIGALCSDLFGIKEIYYHIGKLGDDAVFGDAAAVDFAREEIYKAADWVNTLLNTSQPLTQDAYGGKWSGTVYSWIYTCNLNGFLNNKNLVQEESELGFSVNDSEYATKGQTRFYLPFYVKVIDNAQNVSITHYKLCVDPDLDIPMVNINYPAEPENHNDKILLGGEVRLSGIASDNNAVLAVQIRIKKYDSDNSGKYKYYLPAGAFYFYPNNTYPVYENENDGGGWFNAKISGEGNLVNWYYNINGDGGLDPEDGDIHSYAEIQIRAIDTKDLINRLIPDLVGPVTSIGVYFSSGIPTISNPVIKKQGVQDRAYTDNIRVSGIFTINTMLRDDDGIRSIKTRFNGAAYTKIAEDGHTLASLPSYFSISDESYNSKLKKYERTLTITIDSTDTSIFPAFGYGKTGALNLDVQIIDMNANQYTTNASFKIDVDNFYPRAVINTQERAKGASFLLQGSTKDYNEASGSVQSLERMLVYFERAEITGTGNTREIKGNGDFVNFKGENWSSLAPSVTYPDVRDTTLADGYGGASGPNVKSFNNFPALTLVNKGNIGEVWESPHAMVIDKQEIGENIDFDLDGVFGEVWDGKIDLQWAACFNTTLKGFPDGPLMIHYIIMDEAGNAARYKKAIYIENNKPLITYINLGTDWNGDNNVELWIDSANSGEFLKEKQTIGLTTAASSKIKFAPDFRIRNNKFTLMLDTIGGNGAKNYKVSYVTENPNLVSASNLEIGKVYTIAEHGGIDWVQYGAPNNNVNTTFAATGKHTGTTSAKAISYNENRVKSGFIGTGNASVSAVNFTEEDFGLETKGLIPDSIKDSKGDITSVNQNKRLFIINVYDSAVASRPAEDQNMHAVLIAVDIDNTDLRKPEININPFFWNSLNDNSLYDNSKENGHIELEAELPKEIFGKQNSGLLDLDPKVSGIISISGSAFDNNTIEEILFSFAGKTEETGALYNTKNAAEWITKGDLNNGDSWQFVIVNSEHNSFGHHVEWRADIDTAKFIANAAQTDCVFTVRAKDNSNAPNISDTSTIQTSENLKTPYYRMDIVPYINKITTNIRAEGGLRDSNIRSADGKYSVRRNEKNIITVEGFNLKQDTANGAACIITSDYNKNLYNPSLIPQAGGSGLTFLKTKTINSNLIEVSNEDKLASGYLTIWTNGIGTLNNINNNESRGRFKPAASGTNASNGYNEENMPNREADRFTTKNITLTDDRYIQFYHVVDTGISNAGFPVMIMNNDNPVFGYIKDNGGPASTAGPAAGTGAGSLNPTYAAPQRREADFDTGAEIYTEYLIKGSMWDGMGMTRDESGRYMQATTFARDQSTFHLIYDRFCELHSPSNANGWGTGVSFGGALTFAHSAYNNAFSLETVNCKGSLNIFRYQYPKLYAKGNSNTAEGAAFYLLYFDEVTKELAFRNFKIANNKNTTPPAGWIRLSNTGNDLAGNTYTNNHTNMRGYDGAGFIDISGVPKAQYDNAQSLEARKTAAGDASRYFDFAVTEDNHVIIIYYDEAASRLKMRYSAHEVTGNTPTQDTAWIDSGINFPLNVGMYVSMAIDGSALHISANDSNKGDLVYIYVKDYIKKDFKAAAVDKFGTTGNWTDIKLKPGTSGVSAVPYIAYFNMADIGSRDSNRVAYMKLGVGTNPTASVGGISPGADINGYTTGKWEYTSIPAITAPQGGSNRFQRVNLGFMSDGTPVIGYLGSNIEFAYPIWEW